MPEPDRATTVLTRLAGAAGAAFGAIGLIGWIMDSTALRSMLVGAPAMKPSAALGLLLAGGAVIALDLRTAPSLRRTAQCVGLIIAVLAVVTLGQDLFAWRHGIDTWAMPADAGWGDAESLRMAPLTAVALAAIGSALVLAPPPRLRRPPRARGGGAIADGPPCLLGYAWHLGEPGGNPLIPAMAVHAALGLVTIGAGLWLHAGPGHGAEATRGNVAAKVAWSFAAALVILVIGGGSTYRAGVDFGRAARQITDSQQVLAHSGALSSAVSGAESAQLLYLLTEDPAYRAAYERQMRRADLNMAALEVMGAEDPVRRELLHHLSASRLEHADSLRQTLAAFDAGGPVAARVRLAEQDGVRQMDALREAVLAFERKETSELASHEARAEHFRRNSLLFLLLTLGAASVVFAVLLYDVRRALLARADAESRLRGLNAELERRVAERTSALERERRRFFDLFDLAPDAMMLADRSGQIVRVNRQAEALSGWSRGDLSGRPVESLLPPSERGVWELLRERLLHEDSPQLARSNRTDLHVLRRDGSSVAVGIALNLLSADGDVQLLAAVRDISALVARDQALRRSVERYRRTLDSLLEGCQIIDFEWRYVYVNSAAAEHGRRPAHELLGRTMMDCYPGIETTPLFALMSRSMQDRASHLGENEFTHPDGSTSSFRIGILPVPEGIAVFSIDITASKQAERRMLQYNAELEQRVSERTSELVQAREAAEDASRAKSAFLAVMSHEIRTPMNGVVGMVDVLSHSPLSESQADAVRTIRASALALLALIDDILDFSKIEAGRLELERGSVSLAGLAEEVCESLQPMARDKGVDLDLFVDPNLPERVWTDATRLRQILVNLASNAVKFSGGRPERPGRVRVRIDPESGGAPGVVIRVADNGIGMTLAAQRRLFESFTQAEPSTTRRYGGTGLGLAICRRLVALMAGEIAVRSAPDHGSTFTVRLPLEPVAAPGGAAQLPFDMRDVACVVVGGGRWADDVCAYLVHAGANVHGARDLHEAARHAATLTRPVVIHGHRGEEPTAPALRAAFAGAPDARHLWIAPFALPAPISADADRVALAGTPLRRLALLRAVAVAAGRASPDVPAAESACELVDTSMAAPGIAQARAQGRLILVAEDDAVSQKVILKQLELLGYSAELASDGRDALRRWRDGGYAMLLTDLHMPEMDGYMLTSAIRADEAAHARSGAATRLPIIALTANALRNEAARALASGMDEYLTKPLRLHLLQATLARWLPHGQAADVSPSPRSQARPQAGGRVDVGVLRELVGDDDGAVRELLAGYLESARSLAGEFDVARDAQDHRALSSLAHRLKSSSRSVGALELGDLCAQLESACRAGVREPIERLNRAVELAIVEVTAEIDRLLAPA